MKLLRGSAVDQGVDSGLDVTVLVLAYCLRDGRIVDIFLEIGGKNIKLVDHDDEQPWPPIVCLGEPPPVQHLILS